MRTQVGCKARIASAYLHKHRTVKSGQAYSSVGTCPQQPFSHGLYPQNLGVKIGKYIVYFLFHSIYIPRRTGLKGDVDIVFAASSLPFKHTLHHATDFIRARNADFQLLVVYLIEDSLLFNLESKS